MAATGTSVLAQDKYPSKIIRVLTASTGSNHDWGARIVAQELTPRIGQRVIVENRGSISTEIIAKDTPPDGVPQGVVEWDVEVTNQNSETCAVYSSLTLVERMRGA